MTLIEAVAVCAIIGVLTGLVCIAAQNARESARRVQCTNHLKQFGTALSQNESIYQIFGSPMPSRRRRLGASFFEISGLYELLPALDEKELYNAVNISARHGMHDRANLTAAQIKVAVFLCPSDSVSATFRSTGPLNYRYNVGAPRPVAAVSGNAPAGAFTPLKPSGPAEFQDGLSATVGVSERVVGSQSSRAFDPFRDCWYAGVSGFISAAGFEEMQGICSALRNRYPRFNAYLGRTWSGNTFTDTWYNHVLVPNSAISDCSANSTAPGDPGPSAMAARSFHTGGVNVLYMDGSVRRVSTSIELKVWRALGTRSAGEVADVGL